MNDLSIILPVYNERDTIQVVLKEWERELSKHNLTYVFIICEDGSTDGTKTVLAKLKGNKQIILDQKEYRRGYGGAVLDGIKRSDSHYILCIDSDGQCDPKDFSLFWKNKDRQKIIIGWRIERADAIQRKLFSKLFKSVFDLLFPNTIHDPSAPFVLFKKRDIESRTQYLTYLREGFWWGFVGMCVKTNLSLYEIPINHRKRLKGDTQVYTGSQIPSIALRNLKGLIQLKVAS